MSLDCANHYDFSICSADSVGGWAHPGDGNLTMYDANGSELWTIDGAYSCNYDASMLNTSYEGWSPPTSGYYYLKVDEDYGNALTYKLAYKYSAPDPCAGSTTMSDGVLYSGTLGTCGAWSNYAECGWDEAGQERVYEFSTTVAGVYTLTAEQTDGAQIDWCTGSCGGAYVGTGTSINVSPGVTSTYYARARNASTGCESAGCGSTTVTVIPTGSTCGDPTDTDCDNPDTCDEAGNCVDNLEPAGTFCGDRTDTDCDNPDTCNGAGDCEDNFEPAVSGPR